MTAAFVSGSTSASWVGGNNTGAGGVVAAIAGTPIPAGRMLVCSITIKPDTVTLTNVVDNLGASWTIAGSQTGGTGTFAADTGPTRHAWAWKVSVGGETQVTVTASNATAQTLGADVLVYSSTVGAWATPLWSGGSDSTNATTFSIAGGTFISQAGDVILGACAINGDLFGSASGHGLTHSSDTFTGSATARVGNSTTLGNDAGMVVVERTVNVSSGISATPVVSFTTTGAGSGAGGFLILREQAGPTAKTGSDSGTLTEGPTDVEVTPAPTAGTKLAEYAFDEGSGLVAADSSGNSRNLAASNASTSWDAAGRTGAGARVEHTGAMGPNTAQTAYTVMYWVKRTGTWSGWAASFGIVGASWYIEHDGNGGYNINWFDGSSITAGAGNALGLNTWVHIAAVLTGGTRTLYVNGVAAGTSAGSSHNFGTSHYVPGGPSGVSAGENSQFVGVVDDLRIFATALTAGQIADYMHTAAGGPTVTTKTGSDSGTGSDAGQVDGVDTGSDAGTGSDLGQVAASAATSDTGALTDQGTLATSRTATDSGTLTDAGGLAAAAGSTDSGGVAEASTIIVTLARSDAGVLTDTGAAEIPPAFLAATDTGAAAETSQVGIGRSESAVGTESVQLAATDTSTDSGALTDAGAVAATRATSDDGTLNEAAALIAALARTDAATLAELSTVAGGAARSDQGLLAEISQLTVLAVESGTFTEQRAVAATLTSTDSGAGGDSSTLNQGGSPAGSDAGVLVEVVAITTTQTRTDSGTAVETVAVAATFTRTDTGVIGEAVAITRSFTTADAGTLLDSSGLLSSSSGVDAGALLEVRALLAMVGGADLGGLTETSGSAAALASGDAGLLVDLVAELDDGSDKNPVRGESGWLVAETSLVVVLARYQTHRTRLALGADPGFLRPAGGAGTRILAAVVGDTRHTSDTGPSGSRIRGLLRGDPGYRDT